jgi:dimeric dUTPase (all-alpha-NTP-PPase superfamily)
MCSWNLVRTRNLLIIFRMGNGNFQYYQDKQALTLDVRVGDNSGHLSKSLRYFSSKSGIPQKFAVPWLGFYFLKAA